MLKTAATAPIHGGAGSDGPASSKLQKGKRPLVAETASSTQAMSPEPVLLSRDAVHGDGIVPTLAAEEHSATVGSGPPGNVTTAASSGGDERGRHDTPTRKARPDMAVYAPLPSSPALSVSGSQHPEVQVTFGAMLGVQPTDTIPFVIAR